MACAFSAAFHGRPQKGEAIAAWAFAVRLPSAPPSVTLLHEVDCSQRETRTSDLAVVGPGARSVKGDDDFVVAPADVAQRKAP